MSENILDLGRDIVVIGYLFVVRIGVPIIATLLVGWWLERKLAEWDAEDAAALEKAREKEPATVRAE